MIRVERAGQSSPIGPRCSHQLHDERPPTIGTSLLDTDQVSVPVIGVLFAIVSGGQTVIGKDPRGRPGARFTTIASHAQSFLDLHYYDDHQRTDERWLLRRRLTRAIQHRHKGNRCSLMGHKQFFNQVASSPHRPLPSFPFGSPACLVIAWNAFQREPNMNCIR